MIVLHQFPISPFCDKVRRILNVKKVPYRLNDVPLLETYTTLPRINPIGKVPCLEDGDHKVADSSDIARYLEERYPNPPLVPAGPRERALCHVLEDWADESLYFYEMRLRLAMPHNAKRTVAMLTENEPAFVKAVAPFIVPSLIRSRVRTQGVGKKSDAMVVSETERHADAIAGWLGDGAFLVGDALTIADISVFTQLVCIRGTDEGGPIIDSRPALAAWMDRVDRATASPA